VRHAVSERSVVRHEKQPFGVDIQPAHVIKPRGNIADELLHRLSALRIVAGADDPLGL
jgi:hypothetical protein